MAMVISGEEMDVTCIADLHGHYPKLEGGDLLIVAGDLTADDSIEGHLEFIKWISAAQYKKVVYIAGNHDNALGNLKKTMQIYLHKDFPPLRWAYEIEYLYNNGTEFEGLKIYGSPWTLRFEGMNPHCMAFTVDTEEQLAEKWALIPDDIDILVTHSPPKYGLDKTIRKDHVGSESLKNWVLIHEPKLHVFGHIHESYGIITGAMIRELNMKVGGNTNHKLSNTTIVNASHVDECYQPVNKPIRIIL